MIVIKHYTEKDKEEWNTFINTSKNSLFMFNRDYMDYHSDRFRDHSLMFYEDDELITVLPTCEDGEYLYSHGGLTYGGFLVGNKMKQALMIECMETLLEYMKKNGFVSIVYKCIPYIYWSQPSEEDVYSLYINNAKCVKVEPSTVIDLHNPLEMAKLRKRKIKQAIDKGLFVYEEMTKEGYRDFMVLQDRILNERHGVNAVHSPEEMMLLHTRFMNNIHLYVTKLKNKIIAGTVVYEYDNVVHTQYLAASEEARQIGALDLVVSYVIDRYKEGKRWLDFGISSEDRGRFLNKGLISQKEGFGGRTVTYKTYELSVE